MIKQQKPSYIELLENYEKYRENLLVKDFEQKHAENVAEFGPAEEIKAEEIKLWHFSGMVDISTSLTTKALDMGDLVDVLYQGKLCGSAVLRYEGPWLMADCIVDAAIPARLDYENGESLYLLPVQESNQLQIVHKRPYDYAEPITETT